MDEEQTWVCYVTLPAFGNVGGRPYIFHHVPAKTRGDALHKAKRMFLKTKRRHPEWMFGISQDGVYVEEARKWDEGSRRRAQDAMTAETLRMVRRLFGW
jgi:hypothetical protein